MTKKTKFTSKSQGWQQRRANQPPRELKNYSKTQHEPRETQRRCNMSTKKSFYALIIAVLSTTGQVGFSISTFSQNQSEAVGYLVQNKSNFSICNINNIIQCVIIVKTE